MGYPHKILRKKMFYTKKVTRLPDLTVPTYHFSANRRCLFIETVARIFGYIYCCFFFFSSLICLSLLKVCGYFASVSFVFSLRLFLRPVLGLAPGIKCRNVNFTLVAYTVPTTTMPIQRCRYKLENVLPSPPPVPLGRGGYIDRCLFGENMNKGEGRGAM